MWQKGQSGNVNGRPKKSHALNELLVAYLDNNTYDEKVTNKELLIMRLYHMAMHGDLAALKYLMDRVLGKPIETKDINLSDPILLNIANDLIPKLDDNNESD